MERGKQMNSTYYADKVVGELSALVDKIQYDQVEQFVEEVLQAKRVFFFGFGRILLMMKAFAMRLVHLGIEAHIVGDVTTPAVGRSDLLILGSASGETEMTLLVAKKAKSLGVRTALVTSARTSRIGQESDMSLLIPARAKAVADANTASIQPMSTLFEQSMLLLFDIAVLMMMEKRNISSKEMLSRHSNLE
jgi:6-phospho-3-hexuloisomerase